MLASVFTPTAYVDLPEGLPANPPADTARLFSLDVNGITQIEYRDSLGRGARLAADNVVVVKLAAAVTRGQVVYISGAAGANPLVGLARSDNINTMPGIGLALDTGAVNAFIRVLLAGTMQQIDTSAFTEGSSLFVSATTAGAMTTTLPADPNYAQRVGFVTRSHATAGEILVMTTGVVTAPRLHAPTHSLGGTDPVTVTALAGYPGGTTTFLRSDGTFAAPAAPANVALTNAANTFTTGTQLINTGADATIGLVVKANSGTQSANLQAWQDSTGAAKAAVLPTLGIWSVGTFVENTAVAGAYMGQTGGSPRMMLCDGTAANNVQFENTGTGFRFLYPGVVTIQSYRSLGITAIAASMQVGGNDGTALPSRFWVRDATSSKPMVVIGQDFNGDATAAALRFDKFTSTNARQPCVGIDSRWADATDATRKGRMIVQVFDTAAREGLRIEADGTGARIGAFGAAAVARPTVTGSRGGNAALASLLTALASLGWITDSTTA